eukprot:CAMPEP_0116894228 /NCGR_PEP_ID=MMETSP0467-20121206/4054_1 /TAXON_ID=283647 /ORGANISM="Mesodinium pulex, Strain SPMC105" /LENGTH=42 /DNA_ID= /DNA_START= /DNA_END= /DNA_ORIENTATION=
MQKPGQLDSEVDDGMQLGLIVKLVKAEKNLVDVNDPNKKDKI